MPELKELNEKQKRFCEEWVLHFNGTKSYKKAYPESSDKAAESSACDLLRVPKIEAFIKELQEDLQKTSGISKLRVLNEHRKIAFSSITDLHNNWITRKEFDEITDDAKASISSIERQVKAIRGLDGEMETFEFVKVRLHDKHKSLESIQKMLGFNEPEEMDGTLTVRIVRE